MKLAEAQNRSLNQVKKMLQKHMKKHGYIKKSFIIGTRNFSFVLKRRSSCHRDDYTLILQEDDIPFIVEKYDDVPPPFDEVWSMIIDRYRHLNTVEKSKRKGIT